VRRRLAIRHPEQRTGEKKMIRLIIAVSVILGLLAFSRLSASEVNGNAPATEQPMILTRDQGEVRVWRPLVSESPAEQKLDETTPFNIKVDRRHGGSPELWFGTETLAAGAGIPYHRHLHEDELLYVISGSAHVHVGSLTGDAGPGAIVFIPRNTWVSLQPNGKAPISLVFAFNAPGFDRYMRCESVPVGEHPQLVTVQEDQRCQKLGDVQYR
jgi:mannose-6-phosphate isomerase-like protein (cupin superfamily)